MAKIKFLIVFLLLAVFSACDSKTSSSQQDDKGFFWHGFNFNDSSLVENKGVTEYKFAIFSQYLQNLDAKERYKQVDSLLLYAEHGTPGMYWYLMNLAEKYLYDATAPYRCEECYIPFLEHTIKSHVFNEEFKERPRYQLEKAMKNRVGRKTTNFKFLTREGSYGSLYDVKADYVLLYFNNPDCHECNHAFGYINGSNVYGRLIKSGKLKVMAVYPDKSLKSWEKHYSEYPSSWIVARYAPGEDFSKYDLPAIPYLMLLDKDKKVIVKDGKVIDIEDYLRTIKL